MTGSNLIRTETSRRMAPCPLCGYGNITSEKQVGFSNFRWEMVFECSHCGERYTEQIKNCIDC